MKHNLNNTQFRQIRADTKGVITKSTLPLINTGGVAKVRSLGKFGAGGGSSTDQDEEVLPPRPSGLPPRGASVSSITKQNITEEQQVNIDRSRVEKNETTKPLVEKEVPKKPRRKYTKRKKRTAQ